MFEDAIIFPKRDLIANPGGCDFIQPWGKVFGVEISTGQFEEFDIAHRFERHTNCEVHLARLRLQPELDCHIARNIMREGEEREE